MKRILLLLVFSLSCAILNAAEVRSWTGSNGKSIEAEVLGLEGEVVKIKLKTGREMNVLLSKFAEKDQEIIRKITSVEDPFAEGNAVASAISPDQFPAPADVRFTLELSENAHAKIRIEKTDGMITDDFGGKPVKIAHLPKLDMKTRPDGVSRILLDFKEPLPENMPFMKLATAYDKATKCLVLNPNLNRKSGNPRTDGWCLLGFRDKSCQLPLKIIYDATVRYRGECCNLELIFFDCVFTCHVFSTGEKFEDDLEIRCRVGDAPLGGGLDRNYHDLLNIGGYTLDESFEANFPVPQLKGKSEERFRGGFGQNLNRLDGSSTYDKPLEIKRAVFEGRLYLVR